MLTLLAAPAARADEQQAAFWRSSLSHTAWTKRNGAPSDPSGMVQDRSGMLWISGSDGLYRFDGVRFERVDDIGGNELRSPNVRMLALYGDALWLGYNFGGISVFEHGAVRHYGEAEGVPSRSIYQFARTADGTQWFSCSDGIYWLDGARWRQVSPADGLPVGEQPTFNVLPDGGLLVNHMTGLYRMVPGTHRFRQVPGPAGVRVSQVTGDGKVVVMKYGNPPQLFDPATETAAPLRLPQTGAMLNSVNRDRRNGWWIGPGDGMRLYDPDFKPVTQLLAPHSFSGVRVVVRPFDDREGNLWFMTENGIDRVRETRLNVLANTSRGMDFSVAAGPEGEVWISSNAMPDEVGPHAFAIAPDGRRIESDMPAATASARTADGSLWFGNQEEVWHRRDGRVRRWPLQPGHKRQAVQALASGGDGQVWVSVVRRGVHMLQDGVWQPGGGHAELAARTAVSLHADAQGRIWFGYTNNAIALLDHGKIRRFGPADGLAVGNVLSMFSRRGTLWVGGDQGLARFDKGRFVMIGDGAGQPFRGVSGIVQTAAGELWLHGVGGLARIAAADVAAVLTGGRDRFAAERFDHLDGYEGAAAQLRPLDTLVEANDGRLWYATTSSVGWIDPRGIARNPLAPTPTITALQTDGQRYRPRNGLGLPEQTHNLRVDFTAAVLAIPERARFRSRLIGQDHAWRDAGELRQAFYTNLGPGDYRFEVMAANEDGVWSGAPASLSFHIAPAFYQTLWFKLACAALLAGAVYMLYLRRMHYLTERVIERMRARLDERERIARTLHDTFLQSLQGLILRFHSIKGILPKNDAAQQQIDAALDAADAALDEGRDQLMELRASPPVGDTLAATLAVAGAKAGEQHGVAFTLRERGARRVLKSDIQDELFAIAREALSNALQHSGSAEVVAELTYGAIGFTLAIRDCGKGLDDEVRTSGGRLRHWGLIGMRERASRIGAKLLIQSTPGEGTAIEVSLCAGLAYR
jgi:signal transduction histidine kinase/ligand-binding sensor domain-containing protein